MKYVMLLRIALVLMLLWFVGILSSYTIGGILHILPVATFIMIVLHFDGGKRICG
jgi:F0F1-type ATP synthase assembly protein I